jgi:hypothetical protein
MRISVYKSHTYLFVCGAPQTYLEDIPSFTLPSNSACFSQQCKIGQLQSNAGSSSKMSAPADNNSTEAWSTTAQAGSASKYVGS